jgi:hypothetical protein
MGAAEHECAHSLPERLKESWPCYTPRTMRKTKPTTCQHPIGDGNVYLCPFCNKPKRRVKETLIGFLIAAIVLAVVIGGGIWTAHVTGHDVCIGNDPGEPCP